jgi:hypothetical protein
MIDKIPLEAPFWNKQTLWFFGLGLLGWLLLADAFIHFIPWPKIPPFLAGEWHWWGWILIVVIGVPVGFIASMVGLMMFAAFLLNMSAVSDFVPERMAMRSNAKRGDHHWNKAFKRWQIGCFVWYLPWVLATISSVSSRY